MRYSRPTEPKPAPRRVSENSDFNALTAGHTGRAGASPPLTSLRRPPGGPIFHIGEQWRDNRTLGNEQRRNIISVDVEDYFQVEAFANVVPREQWESFTSRVEANTRRLLDLFDETGVQATCFIL